MAANGEPRQNQSFDARLKNQKTIAWLIVLFVFLFIAISATGVSYYLAQFRRITAEKENELTVVADEKVAQIVAWRNERLGDAKVIQNNSLIAQSIKNFLDSPTNETKSQNIGWMEGVRAAYSYRTYFLLNPEGKVLIQDSRFTEPLGDDAALFAQKVSETNQITFSDLYQSQNSFIIRMDLLIPIDDPTGLATHPIAIFLLRIDPNNFLYPLIQTWPATSQTAETVILKRDGNELVYLNDLRFDEDTAFKLRFPVDSPDLVSAMAARGVTGVVEGKDYRGKAVLAVIRQIPDTGWFMVSEVDKVEIYSDLRRQGWMVAVVLVFVLLAVLSLTYTLIRRQRSTYLRGLLEAELERQKLRQTYNLLYEAGNDIIVVFDEAGIITDVNDRAINAYGYTKEELLQKNVDILSTPESHQSFIKKVKRIKNTGGNRFELIHQKKNGEKFPVEESLRYFEVDGKGYYLDLVRDISERKEAESALAEANEKLKLLLDVLPVGISVLNQNREIVLTNRASKKILGLDKTDLLKGKQKDQSYFKADGSPMPPEEFASSLVMNGAERGQF